MRKISAHYIYPVSSPPLRRGILTLDDEGTILSIDSASEHKAEPAGVEFYNGVLVPGFINCHCHLELSWTEGLISRHTGLPGFIEQLSCLSRPSQGEIFRAAVKAEKQMLRQGIVACGDISNSKESFPLKKQQNIDYHTFIELMGLRSEEAQDRFTAAKALQKQAQEQYGTRASVTLHAPYSVSSELSSLVANAGESRYSLHYQETESETECLHAVRGALYDMLKKKGYLPQGEAFMPVQYPLDTLRHFQTGTSLLLVHNTFITQAEIKALSENFDSYAMILCPKANLYIENKLPPITQMYHQNQPIALGTDSLASNDSLSILDEIKTIHEHDPDIPFETLLQWATKNGAKALGKDAKLGSFEKGKQPGINLICNFDFTKTHVTHNSTVKRLC